jgi:hypothetical protein
MVVTVPVDLSIMMRGFIGTELSPWSIALAFRTHITAKIIRVNAFLRINDQVRKGAFSKCILDAEYGYMNGIGQLRMTFVDKYDIIDLQRGMGVH